MHTCTENVFAHTPEASLPSHTLNDVNGTPLLSDIQLIDGLLDSTDLTRARSILDHSGSLASLLTMGPLELLALPLSDTELRRLARHCEIVSRVLARLRTGPRPSVLDEQPS